MDTTLDMTAGALIISLLKFGSDWIVYVYRRSNGKNGNGSYSGPLCDQKHAEIDREFLRVQRQIDSTRQRHDELRELVEVREAKAMERHTEVMTALASTTARLNALCDTLTK